MTNSMQQLQKRVKIGVEDHLSPLKIGMIIYKQTIIRKLRAEDKGLTQCLRRKLSSCQGHQHVRMVLGPCVHTETRSFSRIHENAQAEVLVGRSLPSAEIN